MVAAKIHPTAIVASGAQLADDVIVGPYAIIEDQVEIGPGTIIGPHAVIHHHSRIGAFNQIHAHVVLGNTPQDISFNNADTWIEIGDHNVLREFSTIHRATKIEQPTRLGSHCFLMAHAHIAHDCQVADRVILTNAVSLGGHVQVDERAIIGGHTGVHQFCRVGAYAMLAGGIVLRRDALPFSMVAGHPAKHHSLNKVGLRRAGIRGETYREIEHVFRALRAQEKISPDTHSTDPHLQYLYHWLAQKSKRGLTAFNRINHTQTEED
ncbi:MAG: acyl-ACP--UDP-N-acetylglucosamine O-acyltransferase [Gammaproteobacteria bacterium]|nr:acyl-ACP--UDP-N-acetylglucosamine O-acyltransferase [Gammaproteobacteria bacterium]